MNMSYDWLIALRRILIACAGVLAPVIVARLTAQGVSPEWIAVIGAVLAALGVDADAYASARRVAHKFGIDEGD